MKKRVIIGIVFYLVLILHLPAYAVYNTPLRLTYAEGDVLTMSNGTEWLTADINMPLMPGDRLFAGEGGRAEIEFPEKIYLRTDSYTTIEIGELFRGPGNDRLNIIHHEGRIYINYDDIPIKKTALLINTPNLKVVVTERARLVVEVLDGGYALVTVTEGYADIRGLRERFRVYAGGRFSSYEQRITKTGPFMDEWYSWNLTRDYYVADRGVSRRYLPPELSAYSYDFDTYGSWIYVAEYGYVWRPTVLVTTWAPYRHGRWVLLSGDYVWISDEPWGWVPYHYGRWVFKVGIGWCWVPPVGIEIVWLPGVVAWFYTNSYIAWVPLAPGEIYRGFHRPYTSVVNITNIFINAKAKNAVTVVHGRNLSYRSAPKMISALQLQKTVKESPPVRGRPPVLERNARQSHVRINPEYNTRNEGRSLIQGRESVVKRDSLTRGIEGRITGRARKTGITPARQPEQKEVKRMTAPPVRNDIEKSRIVQRPVVSSEKRVETYGKSPVPLSYQVNQSLQREKPAQGGSPLLAGRTGGYFSGIRMSERRSEVILQGYSPVQRRFGR